MHTFCNVLISLKSLPSSIAPLMLCSYVTYEAKFSFLYSLILQAQGVRRAWVGDYDTLPQFISNMNEQGVYINIIMW